MKPNSTSSEPPLNSFFTTHPRVCAVILASTKGSRLFPMTSSVDMPKHLLPVAGMPSILRLIAGLVNFPEIVVAIHKEDTKTLNVIQEVATMKDSSADDVWKLQSKTRNQNITIIRLSEECFGSIDALRQVEAKKIVHVQARLVVLPGDLVILKRNINLNDLIRPGGESACTSLLVDVGEVDEHGVPLKESAKAKKGGFGRDEEDIEYIGLSYPKTNAQEKISSLPRIVWKESRLDVEADEDMTGSTAKVELPKPRLHKGKFVIRTEWNDVHVYSLAPWVRQLIVARKSLMSIQGDLLPLLVSRQFQGKKAAFGSSLEENDDDDEEQDDGKENVTQAMALDEEPFAVSAVVLENKTVLRINNIPAYLFACKETVANGSQLPMPEGSKWNGKFLSLVLKDSTIGAKISMKSSIIGSSCQLGSKCRLNNVVVMDNVTIGENCSLQNTILGNGVVLGNNCSLNDCQVGAGKTLPVGTKEKGESFMVGEEIAMVAML